MRWPVLFVLAAACHEPEEQAPTARPVPRSASAVASAEAPPPPRPKPTDDDDPLSHIGEGAGRLPSSGAGLDPWACGSDPRRPTGPKVRAGQFTVTGRLPPEVVKRVVRRIHPQLGRCYQPLLAKDPAASSGATTTFTIATTGNVSFATTMGEITDKPTLLCIQKAFATLSFPQPDGGVVKVVFPLTFSPPEYAFTIGDKPSIQVVEADVVKALEAAGYKVTDASTAPPPAGTVSRFKAEKDGLTFSITLDTEGKLPVEEYRKLNEHARSLQDGSWGLFVESKDTTASQALLDAIHKKPAAK